MSEPWTLSMLYDSDNFVVVHCPYAKTYGFEICDKREETTVFLHGAAMQAFQAQIEAWQEKTPTAEVVEGALICFTGLGAVPLVQH